MTSFVDASVVRDNVSYIRQQMRERGGEAVSLVAVTKTLEVNAILIAQECGCDAVGENYAQELRDKTDGVQMSIPVHFIGAIQSNKIKLIADRVDLWQSVDRVSVIDEIARRVSVAATILLQVNTTHEDTKSGCSPADIEMLLNHAEVKGVHVAGFMTMGPTAQDMDGTRTSFRVLRRLTDEYGLAVCSMGMSGDYLLAVDEGSTMVRIGQAIFGPRNVPR